MMTTTQGGKQIETPAQQTQAPPDKAKFSSVIRNQDQSMALESSMIQKNANPGHNRAISMQ